MKFNKDSFSSNVASHVQNAIDKNIITREDRDSNNIERLHGFIQYELLEYCKDRAFSIDVLRAIEFDQTRNWSDLQKEFGEFKSLLDVALVNLFLYLKSLDLTEFSSYKFDNQQDTALLDLVHDKTSINNNTGSGDRITLPSEDSELTNSKTPDDSFNDDVIDTQDDIIERPRRKIRIAH